MLARRREESLRKTTSMSTRKGGGAIIRRTGLFWDVSYSDYNKEPPHPPKVSIGTY